MVHYVAETIIPSEPQEHISLLKYESRDSFKVVCESFGNFETDNFPLAMDYYFNCVKRAVEALAVVQAIGSVPVPSVVDDRPMPTIDAYYRDDENGGGLVVHVNTDGCDEDSDGPLMTVYINDDHSAVWENRVYE